MASTFPNEEERIDFASETFDVIPVWRFLLDLSESADYIHHHIRNRQYVDTSEHHVLCRS